MKRGVFLIVYFIVLSLVIISCGDDEDVKDETGIITGFVSDYASANTPIVGATVTVSPKGLVRATGSDGRFEFDGLEPGNYTISVSANNYQSDIKRTMVYAGKVSSCDFLLEKAGASIDIAPLNLVFGRNMEQTSFTITNNTNGALAYSISNYPDYIQVTPISATVVAKGKQAVGLTLINRNSITTSRYGQLTVNVGNDSYVVNITVDPYQDVNPNDDASIDIAPLNLVFGCYMEQTSFTITNNTNSLLAYSISNYPEYIQVIPISATVSAKGKQAVGLTIINRNSITITRYGQLTVNVGNNSYVVNITVDPYQDVNPDDDNTDDTNLDPEPDEGDLMTFGLDAYYNFDNATSDDYMGAYNAFLNGGTFITNTPNGKGKALQLRQQEYMTLSENPLCGKKSFSISMWVKDFGTGVFIRSTSGNHYDLSPTWNVDGSGKITYNTYDRRYSTFATKLSNYSNKWTMVTIVSDGTSNKHTLYINGTSASSVFSDGTMASTNCSMQIGGQTWYSAGNYLGYENAIWTSQMKIDNVRIYSKALSANDVKTIYNLEK